jgi:hypothetical protein
LKFKLAAVVVRFEVIWDGPSTVTVNDALLVLPEKSVAVTITVVVPTGKVLPEGGFALTMGAGSTTSVAVTTKVTTAPAGDVAATVRLLNGPVGGVVSCVVTLRARVSTSAVAATALFEESAPNPAPPPATDNVPAPLMNELPS